MTSPLRNRPKEAPCPPHPEAPGTSADTYPPCAGIRLPAGAPDPDPRNTGDFSRPAYCRAPVLPSGKTGTLRKASPSCRPQSSKSPHIYHLTKGLAGFPATTVFASTDFVTFEPIPINAWSPRTIRLRTTDPTPK